MRRPLLVACLVVLPSAALAEPAPIIGGTPTTVGQYPSVVGLSIGGGLCTGTLIHPEWVLTAAHCVTPSIVMLPNQAAVTQSTMVHFGTINLNAAPGTVARAAMTIPKPGFSGDQLGSNDIGLIKLTAPVTNVTPTEVNLNAAMAPVGTKVTMVGYGQTGTGSTGVQFVLENRTSTSCQPYGLQDANLLCFSQTDNKGKCRGDSGGPSFAQIDGKTKVVGVTSFGDGNCVQFGADTRSDIERTFLLTHIPTLEGCDKDADCKAEQICFQRKCIKTPFGPGGLGSTCTAAPECESNICADGPGGNHCTQTCTRGADNACPDGLECIDAGNGNTGACWPPEDGGCCDTSGKGAPTMLLGIGLVALVWRRRRGRGR